MTHATSVTDGTYTLPDDPHYLLTLVEFRNWAGISERTWYYLKRDGKAPRCLKIGNRYRIKVSDALEWYEAQAAAS